MTKARLVITAVTVEKRPVSEVARSYGIARSWIYTLLARYQAEGEAAFEPRSRRPESSPSAISPRAAELIIRLRKELAGQGLDAGPHTIAWHLATHHQVTVSPATISRYLARAGLVTPEPAKRPRSSYIRFEAAMPNECWQSDFTHYPLATGDDTEVLTWLDDHSRYALSVTAHYRVTGTIVLEAFQDACASHGPPASTLTDNGLVFTTRLAAAGSATPGTFERELRRLGITRKNGKPNHPQTQGKVERFQQTLKKWLRAQPAQPADLTGLQHLLGTFTSIYNDQRPHRSLPRRATPATAYAARPKAVPGIPPAGTRDSIRTGRVEPNGTITLRADGRLRHIGIGRTHAGTPVTILARDHHIRVLATATGELLRELTLDLTKGYQPTGAPKGRTPRPGRDPRLVVLRLPGRARGAAPAGCLPRRDRRGPGHGLAPVRHALHRALPRATGRRSRRVPPLRPQLSGRTISARAIRAGTPQRYRTRPRRRGLTSPAHADPRPGGRQRGRRPHPAPVRRAAGRRISAYGPAPLRHHPHGVTGNGGGEPAPAAARFPAPRPRRPARPAASRPGRRCFIVPAERISQMRN